MRASIASSPSSASAASIAMRYALFRPSKEVPRLTRRMFSGVSSPGALGSSCDFVWPAFSRSAEDSAAATTRVREAATPCPHRDAGTPRARGEARGAAAAARIKAKARVDIVARSCGAV